MSPVYKTALTVLEIQNSDLREMKQQGGIFVVVRPARLSKQVWYNAADGLAFCRAVIISQTLKHKTGEGQSGRDRGTLFTFHSRHVCVC